MTVVIVLYLFAGLHWHEFFSQFRKIKLIYLPVLFGLHIFSLWFRAERWRFLFASGDKLSKRKLIEATALGFFASYLFPLRAGEFVRPWVLSRWQPVSFSAAFASVVLERVLDILALIVLLGVCYSQLGNTPALVRGGASVLLCIGGGITLLSIATYFWTAQILRVRARIIDFLLGNSRPELKAKLFSMSEEFISGLKAISKLSQLFLVLAWTGAVWFPVVLFYHVSLLSFGVPASFQVSVVLTVMTALAVAAPSAPGFLGTFQAGCVFALSGVYGFPREFALAYSLVVHAFMFIFTAGLGFAILWVEGLKFRELNRGQSVNGES